jgi:PAS domain S-box-containing protein
MLASAWPRAAEAQFRRLAEGAIEGILVHDGYHRFFANAAYARMFGYPDVAAVIAAGERGQHIFPEDMPALEADWHRILAGQQSWARQRCRRRRVDGSLLWVDLVLGPIPWEGRLAIQGIQIDVTREVEAVKELERSEARFRRLAEESLQGIVIHDGRRRLFANRAFARMLGYRDVEAALAGDVLGHVSPEERAEVTEAWRRTLADQHTWARQRVPRRRTDGSMIWIDLTRGPVMWADQPAIRALLVDVTREVETEAELRRSERRLRAVIDNIPQMLSLKDADRRYQLINHAFARFYGINAADVIGKRPEELPPSGSTGQLCKASARMDELAVLTTGRPTTRERRRANAAGEYRDSMMTKFAVRAVDGVIDGVGTIVTDLTELKQAQGQLVKRERMLRRNQAAILRVLRDELSGGSAVDQIRRILKIAGETLDVDSVVVWRLDCDAALLRVVHRWRAPTVSDDKRTFPFDLPLVDVAPLHQTLRERLVVVLDSERADATLANIHARHYAEAGITAAIMTLIQLPGELQVYVGFGRCDTPHVWSAEDESFARSIAELIRICFFQDELERREQSLRQSEARFRSVIDNVPLVLTLKGADRRFRIVNREFERWSGVGASDAIGRTPEELSDVAALAPIADDEVRDDEREVVETCRSITRERRRVSSAGEHRDIIVTKFPVRDSAGAVDGVGTIITDVTTLKQAQLQLVRRETELRRNQAAILQVLREELSGGSISDRIRRIIALAGETLRVESAALWRIDREVGVVRCMERWRAPSVTFDASAFPWVIPLEDASEFYALLEQHIVLALDDHRDGRLEFFLGKHWGRLSISASLAAMIQRPSGLQDYIGFSHYGAPRAWSVEDQSFARSIAELIGVCFFQDEFERRERALRRNHETLIQIVREGLLAGGTTREMFNAILRITGSTLGLNRVGVWTWAGSDSEGDRVCVALWEAGRQPQGRPEDEPPITAASLRAWFTDDYFAQLRREFLVAIEDVETDPRLTEAGRAFCRRQNTGARINALIQLPDEVAGVVTFLSGPGSHRWTAEDRAFARSVADVVAFVFLSERHRQALAALDLVGQGIYVEDARGEVIYANQVARRLASATDRARVQLDALPALLRDGSRIGDGVGELAWCTRTGELVELALTRTALPGAGAVTVLADVTEIKQRERERRDLEAEMRQAAKLEAVGRLAGGIAHDFNNLLGVVLGFASFLKEDLRRGSAQHGYAARIAQASEHAREVVKQLLAFTRATDVERHIMDLRKLVRDSNELLRASLPSSTQLIIDTHRQPLPALVNRTQIHQILLNLCLNAHDSLGGEPGTVKVRLTRMKAGPRGPATPRPRTGVAAAVGGQLRSNHAYAELTITDDGAGMDADTIARMFDPFFTTKSPGRGTGLGLAVVHGIVSAYDGAYLVESELGRGSRFSIFLPLAETAAAPIVAPPDAGRIRGREAVLVIDDERDLLEMLRIGLERLGYKVTGYADPLKALERFRCEPTRWDVVVTDEMMPGLKGSALIVKLREIHPQCPIVLCSGFSDGVTERQARQAGAAGFFLKPIEPARIAETIRSLLDG